MLPPSSNQTHHQDVGVVGVFGKPLLQTMVGSLLVRQYRQQNLHLLGLRRLIERIVLPNAISSWPLVLQKMLSVLLLLLWRRSLRRNGKLFEIVLRV